MSQEKPILILQMQRMGDLVLSFPLMGWLKSLHPSTPIWVVGEKTFFEGLIEISPPVTYFSYSDAAALASHSYSLIINLSHRPEAAALAGKLQANERLGPYTNSSGNLHVSGNWQLYRSSISHNNRHNLFHWADLNAMDVIPQRSMQLTDWPPVKHRACNGEPRVGLFLGASEPDKRPDPPFWAELAKRLMHGGAKPVLLGGKDDKHIAHKAAAILNIQAINLSGHFSINQLCRFIKQLDLLIVPDTGPMHIAVWTGVPTLNISTGPVNARETGPFAPGHYVLQPSLSCVGCWSCTQKNMLCKEQLKAERVAWIASLILEGKTEQLNRLDGSVGRIYHTRRDEYGLFDMEPLNSTTQDARDTSKFSQRHDFSRYWKLFFGSKLGYMGGEDMPVPVFPVPQLRGVALSAGQKMLMSLSRTIQKRQHSGLESDEFWLAFPTFLRPLSSYVQFLLHNEDFSQKGVTGALSLTEAYIETIKS